ncbi:Putative glycosyltransferase EpsD [Stieleria magnilauensis]|uniref:Glycosyltransferase EpsD n=1 Tax=Stieleria magnilauensis TaxID=2527963 RepID=A0ABX5XLN0_9BACT|nr:Putative glycosyltransferase EpsD [Planctomycetes bacterium TBK1r]
MARDYAIRAREEFNTVFAVLDEIGPIGEQLRADGFVVELLGRRPGLDFAMAKRLISFCRAYDAAMIHAQQYSPFFYSALGRFPRSYPPILLTEHGRHFPDRRRIKHVVANRILIGQSDRCIAVGEQVKSALIRNEGLPADRIDVIYNGIDLEAFTPSALLRKQFRDELRLRDFEIAVVQVARLHPLKDHATALRAFTLLDSDPQIRLFIVGDGDQRPQLESIVDKFKLNRRVTFLGERTDVGGLLNAADLFLLTSISEGIPLTLIEAMATSIACVATRVGGVPEVVVDGETGTLVEAGNASGIAHAIRRLANDSELRRQFGASGLVRANLHFGDQAMHASYRSLYREMCRTSYPRTAEVAVVGH